MRNLLSTLLVFSFLFTIGCEDDDASADTLVGVWNMTSIAVTYDGATTTIDASSDYSIVIIFNEDGTFSMQGVMDDEGEVNDSGTWSTQGNKLTITTEADSESTNDYDVEIWDYTLSGSSFSMTFTETEDGMSASITYNFTKG